jgi:hypothetical protein
MDPGTHRFQSTHGGPPFEGGVQRRSPEGCSRVRGPQRGMPARCGMPLRPVLDVDVDVLALVTNAERFQLEVGRVVMYGNGR